MRTCLPLGLLSLVLFSCGSEESPPAGPDDALTELGSCVSDEAFFKTEVQAKVLTPVCSTCHTRSGLAFGSEFILENSARPDYLEVNRDTLSDIAGLERDGTSIVLLKVQGMEDHGGGTVLAKDGPEFAILSEFVDRLSAPVESCPNEVPPDYGAGLKLLSHTDTLRKASLLLVGRIPTEVEIARVEAGGEASLREVLREQMAEEAFVSRMKEIYNDLLLTNAFTSAYSGVSLLDYDRYPNRYWYEYDDPDLERFADIDDRADEVSAGGIARDHRNQLTIDLDCIRCELHEAYQ